MPRFFPTVAAAVLCLSAPPSLGAQEQPTDGGVRPGDQLITEFYTASGDEIGSLGGTRLVDREGNVFFPYVGTVRVDGLDAQQLRSLLVQRFQPFYNDPVITVNVLIRVNVTDVVGSPGHYFFDPTTTILDALSTAGGYGVEVAVTSNVAADASAVRLVRGGRTITLDLRPDNADQTTLEMSIQSGDWIHVPAQRRSRVRDEVQFWGSVLSFFSSVVGVVVLYSTLTRGLRPAPFRHPPARGSLRFFGP